MKIAIYGQYYQERSGQIIAEIKRFATEHSVSLVYEKSYSIQLLDHNVISKEDHTFSSYSDLLDNYDLLISIGGDGTILRAAAFVRDSGVPILGINAGRLGFLATIQQEDIAYYLNLVLQKKYNLSKRAVLGLTTSEPISELSDINFALNEITINRKDTTSMITIETYLNDEYLNSYWADGLIISTPTGSTGYSLSCGGALMVPEVSSLIITPIAPHNLSARPLIIPEETKITLKVSGRESHFLVSLDSRISTVSTEVELTIQKKPFVINMISFEDKSFIQTLRQKLLWGEDKRN